MSYEYIMMIQTTYPKILSTHLHLENVAKRGGANISRWKHPRKAETQRKSILNERVNTRTRQHLLPLHSSHSRVDNTERSTCSHQLLVRLFRRL